MYLSAKVNQSAEYNIQIVDKKAEITVTVNPEMFHAAGAVHGSFLFKMLDDAAFFAASSTVFDVFLLTTSFNINMLRPLNKGVLRAVGKLVFASKHLLVCEAAIYDESDKVVAFGTGNFAKSKMVLSEQIGYFTEAEGEPEAATDPYDEGEPEGYPGDDDEVGGDPYTPLH